MFQHVVSWPFAALDIIHTQAIVHVMVAMAYKDYFRIRDVEIPASHTSIIWRITIQEPAIPVATSLACVYAVDNILALAISAVWILLVFGILLLLPVGTYKTVTIPLSVLCIRSVVVQLVSLLWLTDEPMTFMLTLLSAAFTALIGALLAHEMLTLFDGTFTSNIRKYVMQIYNGLALVVSLLMLICPIHHRRVSQRHSSQARASCLSRCDDTELACPASREVHSSVHLPAHILAQCRDICAQPRLWGFYVYFHDIVVC